MANGGSIDVFAWNAGLGAVFLIEVKSEMYSVEETLRRFHAKVRLAPEISVEELGWRPSVVGSALVLPESSGVRRRIETHAATLATVFPDRGRDVRSWLRRPDRPLAAIWFLSDIDLVGATRMPDHRGRVRAPALPPGIHTIGAGRELDPVGAVPSAQGASPTPVAPTPLASDDRAELARAGFILDGRGPLGTQ